MAPQASKGLPAGLEKPSPTGTGSDGTSALPLSRKRSKHRTRELASPRVWRERRAGVKCCRSHDGVDLPGRGMGRRAALHSEGSQSPTAGAGETSCHVFRCGSPDKGQK